ncbi:MAG: HEAT repeat domain-containing protein [Elusimicrobiota bacterium]
MLIMRLTSSPHFYACLYIAVGLLAAFNLFEIIFMLFHKNRLDKSEVEKELLKHKISTAIITVTDPSEVLPKPVSAMNYAAYNEAVSSIIESFEGEIVERATKLIYKFEIDLYYKRLSRTTIWFKRAHAIDMLSSLKLKKNREFFYAVFKSEPVKEVRYRIIYGLSRLARDREDIYSISKLLATLPYLTAKYTEDVFLNTITALKNAGKEEEFGFFLKQIMTDAEIPLKIKRDCLSACYLAGCERDGLIVKEYYSAFQNEPAIIIACIRTLANVDPGILPEVLRHKDWRVRLTALKYAHLGGTDLLHDLKDLVHDSNYHIRLNAALALSKLGDPGIEILRGETASTDKFAANAAKYALTGAEAAS